MSRYSLWGAALLVVALVAGRAASQDKKDDPKKGDPKLPASTVPDKKEAEKKLLKTTKVAGEISHIEPNKQAFRLKLTYRYSEPNQGAMNAYIQERQNYATYVAQKNAGAAANAARAMLQHQANFYQIKETSTEVPVDAAEGLKVRLPAPKAAFDDMGNLKKFTPTELAKLRGSDGKYEGEFSDLTTGQIVEVTFVLPKPKAKPIKKDDLALKEEDKIEATRVAVVRQPAGAKP